jgi:hypothetical protein
MASTKVPQALQAPDIPCQVALTHTTKSPEVQLEPGEQTRGSILGYVTTCVFLLRVMDELVHIKPRHNYLSTSGE